MSDPEFISAAPPRGAAETDDRPITGRSAFLPICIAIACLSFWFRTAFPVHAIANAAADDALFVKLAGNLGAGHWLGRFDNLTLVKGMVYPLFIQISFLVGVPLKLAEHGVYLGAAFLAACLVRKSTCRTAPAAILFAALAFNPVLWTDQLARVIREGLYIGLSPAVLVLVIRISFPAAPAAERGVARDILLGAVTGLAAAAFWLTREEGVWLAPAVLTVVAVAVRARRRIEPGTSAGARRVLHAGRAALPWAAAALAMMCTVGTVATINLAKYGIFETTEVTSSSFRHAYGALSRIVPDNWRRYVVFPRDARIRAYDISARARELEPSLDGDVGEAWRRAGCSQQNVADCPEILAGWFQWALRDAVASAGHYRSARDSAAFYDSLAADIDGACDRGALRCLPARATLAPPFRWRYVGDALRIAPRIVAIVLGFGMDVVGSGASEGTPVMIDQFADRVGPVTPAPTPRSSIAGWVAAKSQPSVRVQTSNDAVATTTLATRPADDVVAAHPNRRAIRFELQTDCAPDACSLVLSAEGSADASVALRALVAGAVIDTPDWTLFIDQATAAKIDDASRRRRRVITAMAATIAKVYRAAMTLVAGLACIALLRQAIQRRRQNSDPVLMALATGSAVAVLSRIALLAYLDVTAIPSTNTLYASPATPFMILFAVTGCLCALPSPTSDRSRSKR